MIGTVLVTGGAGFVGSTLVRDLLQRGFKVTVVDDLSMGKKSNLPESESLSFYEHSITDQVFMKKILIEHHFDYVYLLAAVASVADTIKRPIATHIINQDANLQILETIRHQHLNPKKVIFASSAAVYGNDPDQPKTENSRIVPLSPYATDKFATERYIINYGNLYGIHTSAVRFFNVYGPRQNPNSPYSGVLSLICQKLINEGTFTLFGDGKQTRDFIYVSDAVRALQVVAETDRTDGQVYNVATGKSVSLLKTISILEQISNKTLKIKYEPQRPGDIQISEANIQKIEGIGFQVQWHLVKGLRQYWHYNLEH